MFVFLSISHSFPMGVIFDRRPKLWLSILKSWTQFFLCVHIPNARNVT